MMGYEVELPQGLIRWLRRALNVVLMIGMIVGLGFLGKAVSPVGANGRPIFLSPRLAQITAYQRDARRWAGNMRDIQTNLGELLSNPSADLLAMDGQANLLYGRLVSLQAEVDSTSVPPTLETLHASMGEAVSASLDAALRVAAWISEPTTGNQASAEDALNFCTELLDSIYQNPWVQDMP
jgi:hypothetical protein